MTTEKTELYEGLYPRKYLTCIPGSDLDKIAQAVSAIQQRADIAEGKLRKAREWAEYWNRPYLPPEARTAANAVFHALGKHDDGSVPDCWVCQHKVVSP